jgi:hypothetical protein
MRGSSSKRRLPSGLAFRWQYFSVLLVVDALLLNVWKDIKNQTDYDYLVAGMCIGAIFLFGISLRV